MFNGSGHDDCSLVSSCSKTLAALAQHDCKVNDVSSAANHVRNARDEETHPDDRVKKLEVGVCDELCYMDQGSGCAEALLARHAIIAHERSMQADHGRVRKTVDHNESVFVIRNSSSNLVQGEERRGETDDAVLKRAKVLRKRSRV